MEQHCENRDSPEAEYVERGSLICPGYVQARAFQIISGKPWLSVSAALKVARVDLRWGRVQAFLRATHTEMSRQDAPASSRRADDPAPLAAM